MGFFGVKGPKELLASSIAGALSDYFEVDEKAIESNLLRDSKIIIRNAKLKPQTSFSDHDEDSLLKVHVSGCVEEVLLKWTWVLGRSDSQAWMKDVTLSICGFDCTAELAVVTNEGQNVSITKNNDIKRSSSSSQHDVKSQAGNQTQQEGRLEHYIRDQVEQIIDALSLRIGDFKFTLILPKGMRTENENEISNSGFTIGGRKFELKSMGRLQETSMDLNKEDNRENRSLIQYLTIEDFSIDVVELNENLDIVTTLPLLSPISYEATATKHGGKRFDSISKGLTFDGHILPSKEQEIHDCASDIIFSMGLSQLQSLAHLISLVLNRNNPAHNLDNDDELKTKVDDNILEEGIIELNADNADDHLEALKKLAMNSSVFTFPIASISLILPNDVKIKLQSFTCNYRSDGTVMNVKAANGAGILIDDYPLICTKSKEKDTIDTYWMFDLITNCFSIEDSDDEVEMNSEGCTIRFNPAISEKVFEGFNMTLEALSSITTHFDDKSDDQYEGKDSSEAKNNVLFVNIKRNVGFILEKKYESIRRSDYLKINLGALSSSIPLTSLSKLNCKGLCIDTCSFGELSLTIPKISQGSGSSDIFIHGELSLVAESKDVLEGAIGLISSFALPSNDGSKTTVQKQKAQSISDNNAALRVHIPAIKSVTQDASGVQVSMHNVLVSLQPNIRINVASLDSLIIPHEVSLLEPISNLQISLIGDIIDIKGSKVAALLLDPKEEIMDTGSSHHKVEAISSTLTVPIGITISFEKIILKRDVQSNKAKERRTEISIKEIYFSVKPDEAGYVPVELSFGEAKCNYFEFLGTKTSTLINVLNIYELKNLTIELTKEIKLYAGHSFADWSSTLSSSFKKLFHRRKRELANMEKSFQLPNCYISPLQIKVSYSFSKLSKTDTLIQTSEFKGHPETISTDLIKFYIERVINQVPGFLQDTKIIGVNVAETAVLVGGYSLGLAGTIAGVCGVDAIKSNLKAGKESRGAAVDEKYQIGDFVRGITASISKATQAGVDLRDGKDRTNNTKSGKERKGNIIDYSVGASSGVVKYIDKNQAKLAGASAASAGMVAGTILLGPIGLVAGAAIAGTLTEKAVNHIKTKHDDKNDESESELSSNDTTIISPPQSKFILQGLLFKRRDIIRTEWSPRWFVLDVEKRALKYHMITKNAPPSVDTNILNLFKKPAPKKVTKEDLIDFETEPKDTIGLSTSRVEIDATDKLTNHNLFVFKVCNDKQSWSLAANSNDLRVVWVATMMDLSEINTSDDILNACKSNL